MKKFIRRSSSLADVSFGQALRSETQVPLEGVEGFGCPFNAGTCDDHCSNKGYRGGYCKGALRQTCVCYG